MRFVLGLATVVCALGSIWAGVQGMQGNASAAALCVVLMVAAVVSYVLARFGGE